MIRPQTYHRSFAGRPELVAVARRFTSAVLGGCPATAEVLLAVSELAGNAVTWTRSGEPGGTFMVRLDVAPLSHVATYVADLGPAAGRCATPRTDGGRGLRIVAAIAQAWGVTRYGCAASAGPVRGEPAEAARVVGRGQGQCVWFRAGWQPAGETAGEAPARVTRLQVLSRAGGRCECAGVCGRPHGGGRCPREEAPSRPLHLVPVWPTGPAVAASLPAALMVALCPGCRTGADSAAGRLPEAAAESLFDIPVGA